MKWHYTKSNDFPVGNSSRERVCIGKTKCGKFEILTYSDYDHFWYDPISKDPCFDKEDIVKWISLKDIENADKQLRECAYVVQTSPIDDNLWFNTVESYTGSYEEALDLKRILEEDRKDNKVRIIVREIYEWVVE